MQAEHAQWSCGDGWESAQKTAQSNLARRTVACAVALQEREHGEVLNLYTEFIQFAAANREAIFNDPSSTELRHAAVLTAFETLCAQVARVIGAERAGALFRHEEEFGQ